MREETRKKLSLIRRDIFRGTRNPMYGKKHTIQARLQMGEANLGRKMGQGERKMRSEAHKGLQPAKWGAGFKKGNIPWNKYIPFKSYMAGFFDGDGTFDIRNGSSSNSVFYKSIGARIQIVDGGEVLQEAKKLWGGWIYVRERSKKNPRWSDTIEWQLQGQSFDNFLRDIFPFLKIKKRQAEIVLEYRKLQTKKRTIKAGGTGLVNISDKELAYRKQLETELKSLKLNKGKKSGHQE